MSGRLEQLRELFTPKAARDDLCGKVGLASIDKQARNDVDAQGEDHGVEGKGEERRPCSRVRRRMERELTFTSDTWQVIPTTKEK